MQKSEKIVLPSANSKNCEHFCICTFSVLGVCVGIVEIIFMILSYIYYRFTVCTFCGIVTFRYKLIYLIILERKVSQSCLTLFVTYSLWNSLGPEYWSG